MKVSSRWHPALCAICCLALIFTFSRSVQAQQGGNGGNQGGGGNQAGGILIDADGVISSKVFKPVNDKLNKKRLQEQASQHLSETVNTVSPLRKVSLPKLEEACRQAIQEGKDLTPEMRYLAGINRIDYIFLYPESHDLVIAGPAEGFAPSGAGHVVGTDSGRPPLQLEDLLIALRTIRPGVEVGCSIDVLPDRLNALRSYLRTNSSATSSGAVKKRFHRMAEILGMQKVTVMGVPADSHYARVLVEADYRMKRITTGLEPSRVRGMKSYLTMLKPGANTIQRWYFLPMYDMIGQSDDGLTYQLSGQRLQLRSQEQIATGSGRRRDAARTDPSITNYSTHFTKHIPELAEKNPIFAKLQNLFDLAILTALVQRGQLATQVNWDMSLFLDEDQLPTSKAMVPRKVVSEVSYKRHSRGMMLGLVSGGVMMTPETVLRSESGTPRPVPELAPLRQAEYEEKTNRQSSWWWD